VVTDVLYFSVADLGEEKLVLAAGMQVKFKSYTDSATSTGRPR